MDKTLTRTTKLIEAILKQHKFIRYIDLVHTIHCMPSLLIYMYFDVVTSSTHTTHYQLHLNFGENNDRSNGRDSQRLGV